MYSGFSIIQTLIIRIRTFGRRLMSPCFRYKRKKDVVVTGVLLQEKQSCCSKDFPKCYDAFSMQYGIYMTIYNIRATV